MKAFLPVIAAGGSRLSRLTRTSARTCVVTSVIQTRPEQFDVLIVGLEMLPAVEGGYMSLVTAYE